MDNILVVGSSGGIGHAVVEIFSQQFPQASIHAISRSSQHFAQTNITVHEMPEYTDEAIHHWCTSHQDLHFRFVVVCIGVLHGLQNGVALSPEKRLDDLNADQLTTYFAINSVIPALWLKHLALCIDKQPATICCVSARVGSISDNQLGGWYGYRASKAALNMLMKTASVEYRRRKKNTALVCYHPGTVDTSLSKPFQSNVRQDKLFEPSFTAQQLVNILIDTDVTQGPYYVDWAGKPISW